jgi:micrococcal nuclease
MRDAYVRAVDVVRVIDGDTVVVDVDLGFYVTARMSCRIEGINAPDRGEGGHSEAAAKLAELLGRGEVTVESIRADKYAGRFDAFMVVVGPVVDGVRTAWDVGRTLVAEGYAVPWDGRGPRPLVPWPVPSGDA